MLLKVKDRTVTSWSKNSLTFVTRNLVPFGIVSSKTIKFTDRQINIKTHTFRTTKTLQLTFPTFEIFQEENYTKIKLFYSCLDFCRHYVNMRTLRGVLTCPRNDDLGGEVNFFSRFWFLEEFWIFFKGGTNFLKLFSCFDEIEIEKNDFSK